MIQIIYKRLIILKVNDWYFTHKIGQNTLDGFVEKKYQFAFKGNSKGLMGTINHFQYFSCILNRKKKWFPSIMIIELCTSFGLALSYYQPITDFISFILGIGAFEFCGPPQRYIAVDLTVQWI